MSSRRRGCVEFDLIHTLDKVRMILVFSCVLILATAHQSLSLNTSLVGLAVALAALASVWSYFFLRWDELLVRGRLRLVATLFVLLDLGVATILVLASGGWDSHFDVLLLLPIVFSAVLFSAYRFALPLTTAAVALNWVLLYAQSPGATLDEAWVITGRLTLVFAVAWFVWRLTRVLERERRTQEAVIRNLPEGVLLVAEDGSAILANPRFADLCGLEVGDFLGAPLSVLVERPGYGVLRRLLADAFRRPTTPLTAEITLEGRYTRDLRCSTVPCFGAHGDLLGWVVIAEDVTDIKAVTRVKEAGIGILSHELKSPLASMNMLAKVLSEMADQLSDSDRQLALETIQSETHRLARMVTDTLDIARLEQEDYKLAKRPLHWAEVAERILVLHGPRASQAGVALVSDVAQDLPAVLGDCDRVLQIVTALVLNALQHTPAGGEIRLSARAGSDRGEFSVSDTGCGIPPEARELIFEKFGQVPGQEKCLSGERGLGLGLYVARLLARKQGGDLLVESEVGVGSTFRLILPLAPFEENAVSEAVPLASSAAAMA